ncbi:hypothetical protein QQS21_001813 [Conoideocrella luteorostrata]|uniref:Transmembrane protein UsgS n=1 Tax=Conoideocrella luteorostrata TaxID=1105319 RepID=A0AAJ0FX72_9HYPO|nr:hypothetical protein QQS21_001813 [Conoideocrella luteorostrata]
MSNFEPNGIIRGVQLTLVGAHRALQNPKIFTTEHYRQVAYAVAAGMGIRLLVAIPIITVKLSLRLLSVVYPLDKVSWDDSIISLLNFTADSVLQVPFFLMTVMRYFVPTLDNLFMQSLEWVDITYVQKHKHDNPDDLRDLYYPNLSSCQSHSSQQPRRKGGQSVNKFITKFARRACLSIAIFSLSYLPMVGKLVLPMASFYTFHKGVGLGPAALIFSTGLFLPRRYLFIFLQSYYASRNLMRELLEPYFARVPFTKEEKRNWFRNREGVLFGFAIGFYLIMRVPLFGVLMYGIAEASTAYLITKITDPPPQPTQMREFATRQQNWRNKHEFLKSSIANIDNLRREPVLMTEKEL